ncbi:MAG: 30S ribosomal protein S20 [Microthrixaceae bacterium]
MANIKSQIKRNKQNEKARLRNKAVRSNLKTRVRSAEVAAAAGADEAEATLRTAISTIDRAATKGVIHANAAARKKSRLVRRLAALGSES